MARICFEEFIILLGTDTFVITLILKKMNENPPGSHKNTEAQKRNTVSGKETFSWNYAEYL